MHENREILIPPNAKERTLPNDRFDDSFDALLKLTARQSTAAQAALAIDVVSGIPVYEASMVHDLPRDTAREHALREEWCSVLREGAGVFVVRRAIDDHGLLDQVTKLFETLIAEEAGRSAKDHFAAAGANSRIWNAHEKLAVRAPALFACYNACRTVALASDAWLGPGYQITAQVNVVPPGGDAQDAHRDYHLGFMDPGTLARYPRHVHLMSSNLTLQGAIAHSDMPLESGPTRLLPYSQMWPPGYAASTRSDVRDLFAECFVQLPMAKGDALFFNPALLHAAGDNRTTDHPRIANLLQVSSAFGRAMEIVDRARICECVYPVMLELLDSGKIDMATCDDIVAASAEGYPFPANLDIAWEGDGLRPPSQQDVLRDALARRLSAEQFGVLLATHRQRQRSL